MGTALQNTGQGPNADSNRILEEAREFFDTVLAANHVRNTRKLERLEEFNVNPFLVNYLAAFAFGDTSPESLAKALVYPRALGTSINTSFGQNIQNFCHRVLAAFPSTTQGMDIEFDDQIDGRHKYCQVKAGPNTINADDVPVVVQHFKGVRNLARTNGMTGFNDATDCCVAVLYGTADELSGHYQAILEDYPVYVGQEFWHRLTGDPDFYRKLSATFADCAKNYHSSGVLDGTVEKLARDIERHPEALSFTM